MQNKQRRRLSAFAIMAMFASSASALPVIPGATGFGIDTPAGRGGKVIRVTNLNATGDGSLHACVRASGPRICIFEVSGTIRVKSDLVVNEPYLTIAGQTAPAPGIMVRGGALKIKASNVLVQHIAVRVGDAPEGPSFTVRGSLSIASGDGQIGNIVVDHCSFSWGIDETAEVYGNWRDVTISNTIISEGLRDSFYPDKPAGFAFLADDRRGNGRLSMIGNLIAHSIGRNPRSNSSEFVLVNNVVYNTRDRVVELFNKHGLTSNFTVVGNVFIKGPSSLDSVKAIRLVGGDPFGDSILDGTKVFIQDNLSPHVTDDPWSVVDNRTGFGRSALELPSPRSWPKGLDALPSSQVVNHVLENVGTRPADRNKVDARVIADVRNRTGRIINCVAADGSARCNANGGGWPQLAENRRKLTIPDNPNSDHDGNGYTRMEEWLHAMAAEVEGRSYHQEPPGDETPGAGETPPDVEVAPPRPPHIQN